MLAVTAQPLASSVIRDCSYDRDDEKTPGIVPAKRKLTQNPSMIMRKRHIVDLGDMEAEDIIRNLEFYTKDDPNYDGPGSPKIEDPHNPRGRSDVWREHVEARTATQEREEEEDGEYTRSSADTNYEDPETVLLQGVSAEGDSKMRKDRRKENKSYPPVAYHQTTFYDGVRIPKVVAELPLWRDYDVPPVTETFSLRFLKKVLVVSLFAEGWYFESSKKRQSNGGDQDLALKSCMILDGDQQPLLPVLPCENGAQISAFLSHVDEEMTTDDHPAHLPVFIKRGSSGYEYYGTYHEQQWSDRLSRNEMLELPEHVKLYWARRMGQRRKPLWAMNAIKEAWPKTVIGWLGEDKQSIIDYCEEFEEALGEPLKTTISDLEARAVTAAEIMEAFDNPDRGDKPAMRLYFEYLQCDGYDRAFYDALVAKKNGK